MVKWNYNNGKIYRIINENNETIYIGSTISTYLSTRYAKHEHKAPNHKIILIENYPCNSKAELCKREQEIIDENSNLLNKMRSFGRDESRTKQTHKEYYENNKQKIKEKIPEHNKDKPKIFECEKCGYSTTRKANWERHLVSKIHLNGKKKYHCEKCNIDFTQKCELTAHSKTNKCRGICPVVDKKKMKQTKAYLEDYKFKMKTNEKALEKIMNRLDTVKEMKTDEKTYEQVDKRYGKNLIKYNEHKLKYKKMFDKAIKEILTPYFNPTWRAICMWYYNAQ